MKSSWFSIFKRKDRHRGTVIGRYGQKTGCIQICPVCERPLSDWELQWDKPTFFVNNVLVKQFDTKPDRIYIAADINTSLYGSWGGSQDLSKLIVCTLCYLDTIEGWLNGEKEKARQSHARQAYDAELDCEILVDEWGVTKEEFEDIAQRRGDL